MIGFAIVSPATCELKHIQIVSDNSATIAIVAKIFHRIKAKGRSKSCAIAIVTQPMLSCIFDDNAHSFEVFYTNIGYTCTKHANLYYDLIAESKINFFIIGHAMEVGI